MPWFMTTSKAVRQCLATRRNVCRRWTRRGHCKTGVGLGNLTQNRSLNSIAGISSYFSSSCQYSNFRLGLGNFGNHDLCNDVSFIQKRGFLGCGDGEEGGVLAKVYEERRVMGYSPEQLFAVVAAVDLYEDFLPWCRRSEIIRRNPDGSVDAELEIGFKFLVESYISHVELRKPCYIKIANVFFREVASRLVGSFNDRCRLIYGPGVPIVENPIEQEA